ncbi:hypothetical protein EMPG_13650 [Blastomyces silverae]|uniref:Uncharacterized protein n=1 Tax=Blastomyces silverae TaxID=2060906 RepID=A0A0H1BPF9_9EURO|nr:hypothetical protein EMPG_13650 [Blastomyces silverae]
MTAYSESTSNMKYMPTLIENITTVREASVRDLSARTENLSTDSEIISLLILKNLTHAKTSADWKYYFHACIKEVNCLKQIET